MNVSAVVPVRDGRAYLAQALESLRAQSAPPLEILVVDDGSEDDSADVAAAIPGVQVVRRPAEGPAAARNAGVELARGEAIAFLDADDLAEPSRLAIQGALLAADPELLGVSGLMHTFLTPEREDELRGRYACPPEALRSYTPGTLLIRRAAFLATGGLDTSLSGGEVVDWVRRCRADGLRFHEHDDVVLRRRIHGDNLSLRREQLHAGYLAAARAAVARRGAAS